MRKVCVLGIGQSMFGKFKDLLPADLGTVAAKAAIEDAGIDPRKIQIAYGSRWIEPNTTAQSVLKNVGITQIEMINVENACGSGITATNLLWRDIAYGIFDVGIVVGVDSMSTSSLAGKTLSPKQDLEGNLGISMPSLFALKTKRLMYEYGATPADLAYPTVKNHKNGCLNPYAMFKKEVTIEEVLNSRMISDPITLLQCCPTTDGAAAVILCSEEFARQYTTRLIYVESSTVISGRYTDSNEDVVVDKGLANLARKAYEAAGVGPEDINVVELHDAFSPEEIWAYESFGFCKRGDSIGLMRGGYFDLGGKVPVNPSGGLVSLGHPIGASGVRVLNDITRQLRGEAGGYQVQGAKVGLAEMHGGYVTGLGAPVAGGIQIVKR